MLFSKVKRYIVPIGLLVIAVGFVVYGIFDDEVNLVLHKAAAICMECIGFG